MVDWLNNEFSLPALVVEETASGERRARLRGHWNLRSFAAHPRQAREELRQKLRTLGRSSDLRWDLSQVAALDTAGAFALWRSWGERLPEHLVIRDDFKRMFHCCREQASEHDEGEIGREGLSVAVGRGLAALGDHLGAFTVMLGQLALDTLFLFRRPRKIPWRDISATISQAGARALGITALVGFLIGVVISYLSALQLQTFGAQSYIVNILGLAVVRELGPLLAAIIVAGRSGSAMTAQIGIMRVTQELDAMAAMGLSQSLRLVLPKALALTVAMPLLVVWTDAIALIGGMLSANYIIGISLARFVASLPAAVPVINLWIGAGKGAVFGMAIALVSCHFGLRIKPNTESLGTETTSAVVIAITMVILIDAVFAMLFQGVGISLTGSA
jgi:phospholipid/cholesterol/gamma-HCH transport system permease protein